MNPPTPRPTTAAGDELNAVKNWWRAARQPGEEFFPFLTRFGIIHARLAREPYAIH